MPRDSILFGLPVEVVSSGFLKEGEAYLINWSKMGAIKRWPQPISMTTESSYLREGEYHCPFSILHEFEKWWEFKYRRIFGKEPTRNIIREMLQGDDRNASDYFDDSTERIKFTCNTNFGVGVTSPRAIFSNIIA